jgi:hypothetical protein
MLLLQLFLLLLEDFDTVLELGCLSWQVAETLGHLKRGGRVELFVGGDLGVHVLHRLVVFLQVEVLDGCISPYEQIDEYSCVDICN